MVRQVHGHQADIYDYPHRSQCASYAGNDVLGGKKGHYEISSKIEEERNSKLVKEESISEEF